MPVITLSSVLSLTYINSSTNPFDLLRTTLRDELLPRPSTKLKIAIFIFLSLLLLSAIAGTACLLVRFRRGESWFYRATLRPEGTLWIPNTMNHWLLNHSIFAVVAVPYILYALGMTSSPAMKPFWMEFIFIPQFLALWHTAWGLGASAHLSVQLPANANSKSSLLSLSPPPWFINLFFVSGIISAIPALLVPVISQTVQWNKGVNVWTRFNELLEHEGRAFSSSGITVDPVATILSAIPESNSYLQIMSDSFYNFRSPFYICASLAAIGCVVTLIASVVQANFLRQQLHRLRSMQQRTSPPNSKGASNSINSNLSSPTQVREKLQMVIWMSVILCVSGLAYVSVCMLGDFWIKPSKVFRIANDGEIHMYLYQFGLTSIDLVIVTLMIVQTFKFGITTRPRGPGYSSSRVELVSPPTTARPKMSFFDEEDAKSSRWSADNYSFALPSPSPTYPTSPAPTYHSTFLPPPSPATAT